MPLSLPPLAFDDQRSFSEHIAISLRDAIRTGELPDGYELNQIALAEHFGVSRVPVREAMRQLQAEGWIDAKRHQRAVVRGFSPDRIVEILELRAVIEAFLIEKTIGAITGEQMQRLEALCDEMMTSNDHRHWLELNRVFHTELYAPAKSIAANALVDQLSSQVERYVRAHGDPIEREGEAVDEHRAILKAVKKRDVAASQALVKQHIGHTLERFREAARG